jgi:SAM-dependent methyltransferase
MAATVARIPYQACPLCDHAESDALGTAQCSAHPLYQPSLPPTMRWLRCTACRHVFVDGYFDEKALALLLSGANPSQLPGGGDLGAQRQVAARLVEQVAALRGSGEGRWLDVGFGNGALLTTAAEFGFEVVGLDLRQEAVRRLKDFGIEAHCRTLESYAPEHPLDVISFADVLEHMPFPRPALTRAHDLLRDGGLVFASMPNMDCFNWQALDVAGKNPYWGEIEHLHNFGRRRLYSLFREHGFEPTRYAVSQRYLAGMEVVARKVNGAPSRA